ncbi:MAG: Gfo/Idh/MocA family oxidoreductase [Spirochaetaceae bacterium]|nr:Gfo/Idh/MocA family oxidoreductase [Spirochaetaceae bacterium]
MINYGMVGGGKGAFIGDVHRIAIRMNNDAQLVAGCFSKTEVKSKEFGKFLNLSEDRIYSSYEQMALKESQREDGIKFVVCVTPNSTHYNICKAFLLAGINVVCDKPLTWSSEESKDLIAIQKKNNLLFGVTYTNTGYPVVKQMKAMIENNQLGKIRFVNCEYPQGWLSKPISETSSLSPWRMDPKISGPSNCLGDIGTHIENLSSYITGLKMSRVCARLDTLVKNRTLDDNATIMVDYVGGAKGLFWSSQIAMGYDNAVKIRIFGEKGSLEWLQEDPDHFIYTDENNNKHLQSRGRDIFADEAQIYSRLPAGHQEGIYEAFANIYKDFVSTLIKKLNGERITEKDIQYPTAEMGLEGVIYVEKCLESSKNDSKWISID